MQINRGRLVRCLPAQTQARIMSRDTLIIRIINAYVCRAARDAGNRRVLNQRELMLLASSSKRHRSR